jgi:hypothetical protein
VGSSFFFPFLNAATLSLVRFQRNDQLLDDLRQHDIFSGNFTVETKYTQLEKNTKRLEIKEDRSFSLVKPHDVGEL